MQRTWIIIALCCLLVGCSGINRQHFFGFKIDYSNYDSDFVINDYDGRDVIYDFDAKGADPDIQAWAKMDYNQTVITIKNYSNYTLKIDYFFDEFIVRTKDGRTIKLKKKQSKLSYDLNTHNGRIKPKKEVDFLLETPVGLYHEDVEKIICNFGVANGARIVLKPLPEVSLEPQ